MFYFIILLLLSIAICFIKIENHWISTAIVLVFMLLLVGLRDDSVGRDTCTYLAVINCLEDGDRFGYIWGLLLQLSRILSTSPYLFLFLMSFITYVPLWFIINKASVMPAVSVLVYMVSVNRLFLETFNICRQMCAIVWVLYAAYFFANDKKYRCIFCMCIAFMLHKITLIAFPFIFLSRIKIKMQFVYLFLILTIILGLLGFSKISTDLLSFLNTYNSGSSNSFAVYGSYVHRNMVTNWSTSEILAHSIPCSLICFLALKKNFSNQELVYYNLLFFGTILCNLFSSNMFCDRATNMLTIFQIIVVPMAIASEDCNKKKGTIYLVILMVLFYVRNIADMNSHPFMDNVLPYKFFFT